MGSATKWLAWVCLSLMLWTAAVESTHSHPSRAEAASCSICVVAHSANPAPSSHHVAPVFAAVGQLKDEAVRVQARLDISELDIRGPPTV